MMEKETITQIIRVERQTKKYEVFNKSLAFEKQNNKKSMQSKNNNMREKK
jgi:hypothetical protein